MKRRQQPHSGFTLVELLVVMFLMAMLATIAIAFFPNAASAQRESRAAQSLQSWLLISKQRALRDGAPRGLRLWVTQVTINGVQVNNVVTDCQYIEQPDDFHGGLNTAVQSGAPVGAPAIYTVNNTLAFSPSVDFTNGNVPVTLPNTSDPSAKYWSVQPGDYVELRGTGLMYKVQQVGVPVGNPAPSTTTNANFLVVSPNLAFPIATPTTNYRIMRSPRVMGDEVLKLPESTLIDLNTNLGTVVGLPTLTSNNPNPLPPTNVAFDGNGFVDILFAPSGEVITRGVSTKNIHLWVRAPNQEAPHDVFRGQPSIISVFVRTGFVGSFEVDPVTAGDPYTLVR